MVHDAITLDAYARWIMKRFTPTSVLDIGCASGLLVKSFRDLGVNAYGIDINADALQKAPKEVCAYLHKINVEKEKLPFHDEFFDLITMMEVIEHLHDFDNALAEIKRILKQDGAAFLTTPLPFMGITEDPTHISVNEERFWMKLFIKKGFKVYSATADEIRLFRRECIRYAPPSGVIGSILSKLGRIGKSIRARVGAKLDEGAQNHYFFFLSKKTLSKVSF